MKKVCLFLLPLFLFFSGFAQLSITSTGTAFTENFDGIGTTATAALPAGFKIGPDWAAGTTATTLAAGTTGTGILTGTSSGGVYNFANGITASSTDRAVGFLTSGSFSSPRSIVLRLTNNTGGTISSLAITFDYEKYRSGSRALDWTFFHGSTSAPATADAAGNQSYAADASNTVILNPPTVISKTVILTGLAITNGSDYYLRWTYTGLAGSTNAQALGFDNFTVTATGGGGGDVTPPTITTLTPPDNATGISIYNPLQIVFNEAIAKGTGNIVIKRISDNTTVQTIAVTNAAVTIAGTTATININPLTNATDYYIEIDAGAFTDIALNNFAGITGNTAWNFTTEALPAAGIVDNNYSFTNCSTTFLAQGWRQYSVTGAQVWGCNNVGRTDAEGLQMNGFSGTAQTNEDWLISPPYNLTGVNLPYLRFYSYNTFAGNTLQLKVSINYLPGSNPNTATWVNLNGAFPAANTSTWTLSDNISLAAYNATNMNIAWVYTSTTVEAARWRLDDITVLQSLPACTEPVNQPTGLTLTPTPTTISGSFTAAVPAADDYLVIRSTAATLTNLPVDGTNYTVGQVLGNGTIIAFGSSTTFTDVSLTPNTPYYYFVFANNNESCSTAPNYNTVLNASQNTGTVNTLPLPACTTPAAAPSALTLTPLSTNISGSFTASASANRYLVVRSLTTSLSATPTSGVTYTTGQAFGGGTVVSYSTANTFTATGLTPTTLYYFFVFAANGECSGEPLYFNTSLNGTATTTAGGGGIPAGYYDGANGLTCAPLKTALYNIIKPASANPSPTYDGICVIYTTTDYRKSDDGLRDIIWDMYSDNPGNANADPYEFEYCVDVDGCTANCNPAPAPNNTPIPGSAEGLLYNREHSFPRSWFGGAVEPMNSDIAHIFPTDKEVNNVRSSWPYGETSTPTFTSLNGSKLGPSTFPGYTSTVFEPINEYKGDFARAQFYMVTAYENLITGWPGSILNGTTHQAFDDWYLRLLYKWHTQDPVSTKETDRNNAVYAIQGNRNPFIDHPEYVLNIWGSSCLAVLPVNLIDFTAQKTNNAVVLNWVVAAENNVKNYEVGSSNDGKTFTKIGEVPARGVNNYSFTDTRQLESKVVYYRLKTTDNDGRFTIGKTVWVKFLNGYIYATVYPNPASVKVTVQLQKPLLQKSILQVTDITGRVVWQQQTASGQKSIELNTQSFGTGRYFIKLVDKNNTINQSFIIAR